MKKSRIEVRAPRGENELARLADVTYQSFAGFGQPFERTTAWLGEFGDDGLRACFVDGEVVGGLGVLRFGQWFGGRSVPSAGISVVSMAPEQRGGGVATHMMNEVLRGLAGEGLPLSVLYPSTYGLYRKSGYETAGSRIHYQIKIEELGRVRSSRRLRPMTAADRPHVIALHADRARRHNGVVDRREAQWRRIFDYGPDRTYSYVLDGRSKRCPIEAFIVFNQLGENRGPAHMMVRDMAAATPDAARAVLAFICGHATMFATVRFESGHIELITLQAPEEYVEISHRTLWMLRILDVSGALQARGWPRGAAGELHLSLADDLFKHNRGKFVLTVADGAATVRKGGKGTLALDVRALASMYSSLLSPLQLQLMGQASGSPDELALAATLFAGPAPWMNDRF